MNLTRVLNPIAVIETICSTFRVAGRIVGDHHLDDEVPVLADIGLFHMSHEWRLKPHSPETSFFHLSEGASLDGDSLLRTDPFEFTAADVRDTPDACALRVVRWIYGSFGFSDEAIPAEFDQKSRRFRLPS
jgi:hypothetical protein